jgi:glutamate synthase domain-containing protein 3
LGAGYACFDSSRLDKIKIKAFVRDESVSNFIESELSIFLGAPVFSRLEILGEAAGRKILELEFEYAPVGASNLDRKVDQINSVLLSDRRIDGRIFSSGRSVEVFKEVGYPLDVASMFGLDGANEKFGDLWLAHTRQPTNSPGSSPIWTHPFSSFDCAIVHNGDISSFGANLEFLNSLGYRSHVGTDSEVIVNLLNYLIRIEGLSVINAATVLTNPFEERLQPATFELLSKYKGAKLDGPFAVVAGYSDDSDTYLIALIDRSKFRPIVIGEDENCFYVASEENQIRILSAQARIWTPEPGSYFVASAKKGLIESGTTRLTSNSSWTESENLDQDIGIIDATGMSFGEINEKIQKSYENGLGEIQVNHMSGQRYIGIGFSNKKNHFPFKIKLNGFPGNCLANLNDGATFEVFGNVGDDLGDTMHSGRVLIHGSARDVVAQALQGGEIFIRGSAGNRAAIQMREYKNHRPYLIVGETADDYLCEYMAGGVVVILNLSNEKNPVGNYVGTGMVGGTIYIRGIVKEQRIGLPPKKTDILNYLSVEKIDGGLSAETYEIISRLEYPSEKFLSDFLPESVFKRIRNLFFRGKYSKPVSVDYRRLNKQQDDFENLINKIDGFFSTFGIPKNQRAAVLDSEFTVIRTIEDEAKEAPIPPQEVPVEE